MNRYITISFSVFCFLLAPAVFAGTNGDKAVSAKSESTTGEHKPKSEESSSHNYTKTTISGNTAAKPAQGSETQLKDGSQYMFQEQDSSNLNSVCKFNFIFYFIYKMKYEGGEAAGNEYLNYEF